MARKLPDLESLYVVGSVARQAQTSESDLDLVAVTRRATSTKQYSRLLRLKTRGMDFNVVSTSLISALEQGETTPYAPLLLTWRKDAVLVHGTDTLPDQVPPMDAHARGVFAFFAASWFLWHFAASGNSVSFLDSDFSRQWMMKTADHMRADSMMGSSWTGLAERLAAEMNARGDPRAVCGLISEELAARLGDLDFSQSDQRRYIGVKLRAQKRLSWRSFGYETPVQQRAMRTLYLLFASGHEDLDAIAAAPSTVRDLARVRGVRDPAVLWNKLQRSVLQELQLVLGFGEILIA